MPTRAAGAVTRTARSTGRARRATAPSASRRASRRRANHSANLREHRPALKTSKTMRKGLPRRPERTRVKPLGFVIIVLALVAGFAPVDAELIERWYSTGVYPLIQRLMTTVSNLVPFALLDVLAVTTLGIAALILIRSFVHARRTKRWKPVFVTVARLTTAIAAIYLVFLT